MGASGRGGRHRSASVLVLVVHTVLIFLEEGVSCRIFLQSFVRALQVDQLNLIVTQIKRVFSAVLQIVVLGFYRGHVFGQTSIYLHLAMVNNFESVNPSLLE